ncbi:MAG: hypothetical protein JOZ07_04485 [Solirubrobacterales bacterium]|nr:hypothetical protein [Solirubrobacterales bacterium]
MSSSNAFGDPHEAVQRAVAVARDGDRLRAVYLTGLERGVRAYLGSPSRAGARGSGPRRRRGTAQRPVLAGAVDLAPAAAAGTCG